LFDKKGPEGPDTLLYYILLGSTSDCCTTRNFTSLRSTKHGYSPPDCMIMKGPKGPILYSTQQCFTTQYLTKQWAWLWRPRRARTLFYFTVPNYTQPYCTQFYPTTHYKAQLQITAQRTLLRIMKGA